MRHAHSFGRQEPSVATAPHPLVAVSANRRRPGAATTVRTAGQRRTGAICGSPPGAHLSTMDYPRQGNRRHGARLIPFWAGRSYYGKPRQNGPALTPRLRNPLETWWVLVRAGHVYRSSDARGHVEPKPCPVLATTRLRLAFGAPRVFELIAYQEGL
jgi:hypothetical protein